MRLQSRMSNIIVTLGGIDFNRYRSLKSDETEHEEPFRFVDGELIERFLEEICKGLGPSVEDMRNIIEDLKRNIH
jgi:DNA damage-binding protein 1